MELLLPAKSLKHTFAAFDYGADACYLGIGNLNARAGATNFSVEEFKKALNFAREKNKKLYIVFNTIVKEKELPQLFSTIDQIYDLNLDGIIVQDIGVATLIKREFPKIPLIASTQMGFHNVNGVKFAEDFGFKRAILARELSLKEIEKIKKSTTIEIEVFIHGAICFTYSGFCFASSFIGGKSGNRGKCSQVCRMLFSGDYKGYIFNLKDLKGFEYVKELYDIGIDSLKIEGRLKDELYVAVNAYIYRKLIDAAKENRAIPKEELEYFEKISKIVFSRKTWEGYFKNDKPSQCIDTQYPGNYGLFIGKVKKSFKGKFYIDRLSFPLHRHDGIQIFENKEPTLYKVKNTKGKLIEIESLKKIKEGSPVYLVHSVKVQNSFPIKEKKSREAKPQVNIQIKIDEKGKVEITGTNSIRNISKTVEKVITVQKAEKNPLTEEEIKREFEKSGNFSFESKVKNVSIPENLFIPKSLLSKIRKETFKIFEETLFLKKAIPKTKKPIFNCPFSRIVVVDEENLDNLLKLNIGDNTLVFLKSKSVENFIKLQNKVKNIGYYLPLIVKTYEEEDLKEFIKSLTGIGIKNFLIPHFYGIKMLEEFENISIYCDFFIPVTNRETLKFLREKEFISATLSVENDRENIEAIAAKGASIILFQDTPLFTSQVCLKKIFEKCPKNPDRSCKKEKTVIKKAGKKEDIFHIKFEMCKTVMFWEKPLNLLNFKENFKELKLIKRFDFINKRYSIQEMEEVLKENFKEGHHANFKRVLL